MDTQLNIITKGFQEFEQRIIETTVKLSKTRTPCLTLLADSQLADADVIILNAKDKQILPWIKAHVTQLARKTTVWVDTKPLLKGPTHTSLKSPILWVNLPIILTRILDEQALELQKTTQQESTHHNVAQTPTTKNKGRVLVVDDSKAIRDYLIQILSSEGYEVTPAEQGEEAIELANNQRYDCVLMDVLMPGIDGYKACREIRRIKRYEQNIPVIMLTSRTSPFDKIRGKMAGCDAYLTKPVENQKLTQLVAEYAGA